MSPQPPSGANALADRWLARWALRCDNAGQRAHPEPEHPYRTCFQRDRDRILHATAFRRLDYKTQVFVPHEQDHFRTRMTHTLEVAQVARTLARALGANEDVVEAAALAHDLGHPPFGHGGESELNALMAGHGGFEHNRQSLRIVEWLEHPYPRFRGLNLTLAVRECLARHETRYDTPAGATAAELPPGAFGPLEAQLVDLADELAYTAADLEDALMAGWIAPEDVGELTLYRLSRQRVEASDAEAREVHKQIRARKGTLAVLVDDALAATQQRLGRRSPQTPADIRQAEGKTATLTPAVRAALDEMQSYLMENVYRDPRNRHREDQARAVLREVFEHLAARPDDLPPRYASRIEAQGLHRVVCDYVAGMTDRFCAAEHARLLGGP